MKETYVQAVLEMIHEGADSAVVLDGLRSTLAARGHDQLYGDILRTVLRKIEAEKAQNPTVYVAKAADMETHASAIADALKTLGVADSDAVTTVDATLVGGFVAEAANTRIDQSYKTKLVSLYRSITRN